MEYSRVKDEKNIANIYQQMLNEDMTSGGAFGGDIAGHAGMENTDWFAPGDARNPYSLGITTRSGRLKKKKGKKRKKVKKKLIENVENNVFNSYKSMVQYALDNFDTDQEDELTDYEEDRVSDYFYKYQELKDKQSFPIYRAIWADSVDDIDLDDIGIFWSFEKNGAKPQNKVNGDQIFILTANVSPDQLDWESGFLSYFHYGEDQWEANLGVNQEIEITEINFKPLNRPISARTGEQFYGVWGD